MGHPSQSSVDPGYELARQKHWYFLDAISKNHTILDRRVHQSLCRGIPASVFDCLCGRIGRIDRAIHVALSFTWLPLPLPLRYVLHTGLLDPTVVFWFQSVKI
jgi:hypothetical protein